MSTSPSTPENAAPAPPMSPDRQAGAAGSAGAAGAAGAGAAPAAVGAYGGPLDLVQAPPSPPLVGPHDVPLPPVPPGQQGAPTFSSQAFSTSSTSSSTLSGADNADQITYSRGRPALHQRPHGPSLLTQALATARGIQSLSDQTELSQSHSNTNTNSSPPPLQSPFSKDQQPSSSNLPESRDEEVDQLDSHHDSLYQSDGDSLTPRGSRSPRTPTMHSAVPASTAVVLPCDTNESMIASTANDYNMLNLGKVNSMLNGHREFLTKSKGRGTSLERTDKERRAQDRSNQTGALPHVSTSSSALALISSSHLTDSPIGLPAGNINENAAADAAPQPRPRKLEHRVTMVPEKAWSIGAGELADEQDGQVEKSITEVIAGVEPNARSRKASHSLRFFKEGLPDEKGKKKEVRLGPHPREKLSATAEATEEVEGGLVIGRDGIKSQTFPVPQDKIMVAMDRPTSTRSFSVRSPESHPLGESPQDYIVIPRGKTPIRDYSGKPKPLLSDAVGLLQRPDQAASGLGKAALDREPESRRKSEGSIEGGEGGEGGEDGEESGEEKISSAVFLPHQGLEQSQEHLPMPGEPPRSISPTRKVSRTDDFHPWLVKAGEPEVGHEETGLVDFERKLRSSEPADSSIVGLNNHLHHPEVLDQNRVQVDKSTIADESDAATAVAFPPKLSRPVSQYNEDNVHEHQWAPKQPLEAIELIPYKHQVGGHTTIWRFSRRAVCKQLNNRENEFYEKIEKYHRDLLAFLPRYIGVLNVTFQKQPRRKSTMRRDDGGALERGQSNQNGSPNGLKANGTPQDEGKQKALEAPDSAGHQRVISQSLQPTQGAVPTVTFVDNQHILPRNLLQPSPSSTSLHRRYRSASASAQGAGSGSPQQCDRQDLLRPSLQERHANSWGATTVNKKLRNEVFNDAFLKQPIAIHRHRKGHHRPRTSLHQVLRPSGSDPSLIRTQDQKVVVSGTASEHTSPKSGNSPLALGHHHQQRHSDASHHLSSRIISISCEEQTEQDDDPAPKDVTGTSAPEPEILGDSSPAQQKKKRRYSGTGLRRKPKDVQDARGDLQYFEEADGIGFKGDKAEFAKRAFQDVPRTPPPMEKSSLSIEWPAETTGNLEISTASVDPPPYSEEPREEPGAVMASSELPSADPSGPPSPDAEYKRVPRPVNPKEAQTQRDPARVEYFLLLEDLTAGMKRPCIMDLKMGTRQYGVEANAKKQKSQQGKCAKTTSRELGVRVCGLQVWDVATQSYVFKDKYYGRDLKKGHEFQAALTRFLYDGVDRASVLRHIPTVLRKLGELEVIIGRLRGYRFYAASLLMFYDGEGEEEYSATADEYGTEVDDSTTDLGTDTEEYGVARRQKMGRRGREIDFKMADFANCVTAGDPDIEGKPCPPRHPDEPDRGFLRGLRSLRKYFLRIQRDVGGVDEDEDDKDDVEVGRDEDYGGVSE
ncbi:hypothetical protein B0T17DRAFT_620248 [Bombardia bombarda]|uniref:Kinase n=1 Tax=Bombardia bombarda TaxID=252184 RepID=A0AA39TUG9_9PEZI|nr:hypothetical protein B0T17DRAFT_620248 [Bombardia bombarda]